MLVKELDLAIVDALGDFLADLMGAAAFNHVQTRPSALGLGSRGGANEEGIFQLTLQIVLLDVVGEGSGDHPDGRDS